MRLVTQGAADVADTLGYAIVVDGDVWPDRLIDRVTVQQMSGVLYQKLQQAEGLMAKPELLTGSSEQGPPPEIEDEFVEPVDRR